MNIAFFSTKSYDQEYFDEINKDFAHEIDYFEAKLKEKSVELAKKHEVICAFVNDQLNNDVIKALSETGVKLIALRSAGFNNVDLDAASKYGIKVVRVPAYSPHAVAEHAIALILTLNRKIHKAYNRVRESNFSLERLTGFDIHGKTIGVIGTGKIGSIFAEIMQGFGCEVIAYDKFPNQDLENKGVEYTELKDLLRRSDIVSLHCPLTPETHHLINKNTVEMMKNGSMLINTSRGALIDTKIAIDALKSGKLGYLGIDVYEQEEKIFFKDLSERVIQDDTISRLMTFPNVLITSHQAFFTDNALREIAKTTLQNVSDFEQGNELKNEVSIDSVKDSK
jgi:D-lactate dehydrogenase